MSNVQRKQTNLSDHDVEQIDLKQQRREIDEWEDEYLEK